MEFRFDISPFLKGHIVHIASNLLPQGYTGDKRGALEASSKIAEIINELGEASARAQGLNKPVTTSTKLRNSDHIVYLLSEKAGKNGCVTGLLKVGVKNLYVFDANGETQMVPAPCILDFYIHESRQRAGLGKELFQTMLEREGWAPRKLAIDRPSEKLVGFLRKHYGLVKTIPQMNNFVVYEGFFNGDQNDNIVNGNTEKSMHVSASPNTALFGPHFTNDETRQRIQQQQQSVPNMPHLHNTPLGRYGAKRPSCSMAEIIHSAPSTITSEPPSTNGSTDELDHYPNQRQQPHDQHRRHHHVDVEQPAHLRHHRADVAQQAHNRHHRVDVEQPTIEHEQQSCGSTDPAHEKSSCKNYMKTFNEPPSPDNDDAKEDYPDIVSSMETLNISHSGSETAAIDDILNAAPKEVKFAEDESNIEHSIKKPSRYTKQHTGLKNVSYNVGAAVTPSDKMEFDQEERESFGVVKINRPVGKSSNVDNSDAHSTISSVGSEGLTDQGYVDLKFYHNKLW